MNLGALAAKFGQPARQQELPDRMAGAQGQVHAPRRSGELDLLTHLRKLEDADYLTSAKTGNGPASRTSVALTRRGRTALDAYTETLRGLLNGL